MFVDVKDEPMDDAPNDVTDPPLLAPDTPPIQSVYQTPPRSRSNSPVTTSRKRTACTPDSSEALRVAKQRRREPSSNSNSPMVRPVKKRSSLEPQPDEDGWLHAEKQPNEVKDEPFIKREFAEESELARNVMVVVEANLVVKNVHNNNARFAFIADVFFCHSF